MGLKIDELRLALPKDSRKSERLILPIKIFYSILPDTAWLGPVNVVNIGGHGLKFNSNSKIDIDAELNFKIIFPESSEKPTVVKGTVVWCATSHQNTYQVGVKFSKMNYEDRKRYIAYISERILQKYLKD